MVPGTIFRTEKYLKYMKKLISKMVPGTIFSVQAGCYLMKNAEDEILYVGKAKNLRKRLASYNQTQDPKTLLLLSYVTDIETIITDTETEALLLEAQLIQQHHPKYNIDLQTPGRYAYIKLTQEEYPRFVVARKITKDGTFFGPYPSGQARNAVLKSLYRIFRLCASKTRNGKPCMRYHLGMCSGACVRAITPDEYLQSIRQAVKFLRGDISHLTKDLEEKMRTAAKNHEFEKAKIFRDQLLALQKIQDQKVSDPKRHNQDIINYIHSAQQLLIQLFSFQRGIISGRKEFSFSFDTLLVLSPLEALEDFIVQYYRTHKPPHELVLPQKLPGQQALQEYLQALWGRNLAVTIPQQGVKKKLLDMVKKNLTVTFGEQGGQLVELQEALHLPHLPRIINCIDISHLGGTQMVGSLVQFFNGQPKKSGYRKFIIKHTKGNNDVASIFEVVTRFATRINKEKEQKPDLLIIDGGKGQLSSALKALHEQGCEIPTIGLAKRLEEIFVSWAKYSLRLKPKSPALQLIRAVRDEAHRFAITFQRSRRS